MNQNKDDNKLKKLKGEIKSSIIGMVVIGIIFGVSRGVLSDFDDSFVFGIPSAILGIIMFIMFITLINNITKYNKEKHRIEKEQKNIENDIFRSHEKTNTGGSWGENLGRSISDGIRPAVTEIKKVFHTIKGDATSDTKQYKPQNRFIECEYCRSMINENEPKCTSCGAPMTRR